jgi:hypothetical protein
VGYVFDTKDFLILEGLSSGIAERCCKLTALNEAMQQRLNYT